MEYSEQRVPMGKGALGSVLNQFEKIKKIFIATLVVSTITLLFPLFMGETESFFVLMAAFVIVLGSIL